MLTVILLSLFSLGFTFAQPNANKMLYVPGEIIIKYEKFGAEAIGSEILSEHQNILKKLKLNFKGINVISCSPVFKNVINEMINKNQTEAQLFSIKTANKKLNLNSAIITKTSFANVLLLKIDKAGEDIEVLVTSINNNPDLLLSDGIKIVYAEPNYLKRTSTGSNDPLYLQQWSHQVTNIEQAWEITQGDTNIKIGIIDTGVDPSHPDLINNLLTGYDFVDIDTTNYKNYYGINCLLPGEDYTDPDNDCTDYYGHGTHCAGIAAAVGDNNIGVKGVATNCKILPVRAGFSIKLYDGENGEVGLLETTSIVNAINYAIDQGVNIISMSFGGNRSNLEEEVIKYAAYRNVVLVAAAGNGNSSIAKLYPAGYDEVLAITSINKDRQASSFTNYGAWTDITAPGEDIISTVPLTGGAFADPSGYRILSGTSMAAPYIAGVAALLLSKNPNLSNNQVYQSLRTSVSTNYSSYNYIGTGLIDVYKAISGNEACVAKITSPHNLNTSFIISQDLDISGRASGKDFKNYIFDYADYVFNSFDAEGAKPHWQPLEGTYSTPVDSGYLGTIHISQQGIYWIRLRVINTSNVEYTDVIGPIIIDKRMKPNWPVSTGYESLSSPAVSDIDKDGKMETVFTSSEGKIYVVDSNGNNKPGWPVQIPYYDNYPFNGQVGYSSPAISDIDNDGKEEIIVRDGDKVYVYKNDGSLKNGWPQELNMKLLGNGQISSPVIADLDNDREEEIILTSTDGKIIVFKSNGNIIQGWPVAINNWAFSTIFINPVVSDLDGDGSDEIIVQCLDGILKKGYLYVFDKSGNILSGWPRELGIGSRTSLMAADINNDGQNEIIASSPINEDYPNSQTGIFVFNKAGTLLAGWPVILNVNSNGSGISAGDINNDGFKEIIVGSNDPRNPLWAIDRNGNVLWSLPGATVDYVTYSQPLIADINGDGKPEILISRYRFENYLGSILTVSSTGQIMQDQKFLIPERIFSTPTIADIDNDNQLELICPTDKGNVFCWDLNAPNDSSKVLWPTYQLNNQRTGSIEPPRVPSIVQLVQPLNNAINQPIKIIFKWNPSVRAISYRIQISDSLSFGHILREDSSLTGINYTIDSLENNKKYYWRMNATNSVGTSNWSEIWSFTTVAISKKLSAGWTWFSLNVADTDMSIAKVLSNLKSTEGDYIKNQTVSATYYNGSGWFGDLTRIDPREMYKIKLATEDTLKFEGAPVNPLSNPITIKSGWNWIGYIPQTAKAITEALSTLVPVTDDYIKNQTVSSTFYDGLGWFGYLNNVEPLDGYMLRSSHTGTLFYTPDGPFLSQASQDSDNSETQIPGLGDTVKVKPEAFQYSGQVTATVYMNGQNFDSQDYCLYSLVGGQIRGVSRGLWFEPSKKWIHNHLTYSNVAAGDTVRYRLHDVSSDQWYDFDEYVVFSADMLIANALNPFVLKHATLLSAILPSCPLPSLEVWPNPASNQATIKFSITTDQSIIIQVFDYSGRLVDELSLGNQPAGEHLKLWNTETLEPGVYYLRLKGIQSVYKQVVITR